MTTVLNNFQTKRNQYFTLEGPHIMKFTYFCPIRGPSFKPSRAKQLFTTTRPPKLQRRTSWQPAHKTVGQLNHSKGPKSPIYYSPVTVKKIGSSSTDNLWLNTKQRAQWLVKLYIYVEKVDTYPWNWTNFYFEAYIPNNLSEKHLNCVSHIGIFLFGCRQLSYRPRATQIQHISNFCNNWRPQSRLVFCELNYLQQIDSNYSQKTAQNKEISNIYLVTSRPPFPVKSWGHLKNQHQLSAPTMWGHQKISIRFQLHLPVSSNLKPPRDPGTYP